MSLRLKALLVVACTFLALGTVVYATLHQTLIAAFQRRELDEAAQHAWSASAAVARLHQDMLDQMADWSNWDDTWHFVRGTKSDYVAANLPANTFPPLKLNLMLFLRPDGRLYHQVAADWRQETLVAPPRATVAVLCGLSVIRQALRQPVSGCLVRPEATWLIAARGILKSDGNGPPAGVLVFGRRIEGAELVELSRLTQLPLRLTPSSQLVPQSFAARAWQALAATGRTAQVADSETVVGFARIPGMAASEPLLLQTETRRTITGEGHALEQFLVGSLGGLLAVVGLSVVMLLLRTVVLPVTELRDRVLRISQSGDLGRRVAISGRDEVGQLGASIDTMLAALEQSQRRLATSEVRYRAVVNGTQEGLYLMRREPPAILDCNPAFAALLQCPRETLLGRDPRELQDPNDAWSGLEEAAPSDHPDGWTGRRVLRRLDGSTLTCELIATWIELDGEPVLCCLVHDISARLQAEAERAELNRRVETAERLESLAVLAGGAAHDFNNLLQAILGHADLARLDQTPGSSLWRSLTQIETAAVRASDLTRQLLAFAGEPTGVQRPVDLTQVVGDTVQLVDSTLPPALQVELRADSDPLVVRGDPAQLGQVVMNLLLNAAEAVGEGGGRVQISTHRQSVDLDWLAAAIPGSALPPGEAAVLRVTDDGCGMTPEVLRRICEPFYSTKALGRGLGLSSVRGILTGHGAALAVHSRRGEGTTFEVALPLCSEVPEPLPGGGVPVATDGPQVLVLVVDDDTAVRAVSAQVLTRAGYAVRTAADGYEGVACAAELGDKLGAAVLDLSLPGLDGPDLIAALRRMLPRLPLLLTSGFQREPELGELLASSQVSFLPKPYRPSVLLDRLDALLHESQPQEEAVLRRS
ncbi:MAG: response regulator [Fimbriimonadaceae bacterium]|nr:response regulator [Fimbriimonadaceae bacterium]